MRFTILWTGSDGSSRVLFERHLDGHDLEPASFSLEVPDDGPGSLALRATKEPEDPAGVWIYFSNVVID